MPTYTYKVKDMDGNLITGTMELDTLSSCVDSLKQKNYYILDVKEKVEKKDIFESINSSRKVKVKDIAVFCRQFSVLINAGIPIVASLATLSEQLENKRLKKALNEVYEDVQKGKTLSESMRKHPDAFPMLLFNMIEAGEVSGTLDKVLNEMAEHFEKENNLNQKIKSALAYPAIVSIVAVLVVIFLVTNVLPTFVGMFKNAGAQLPMPTLILLGLSDSIAHYWYIYLGNFVFLIFLLLRTIKTDRGKELFDFLMLKMPIFGPLNVKIITSRFTRTLSTLIGSGIPLMESLLVVEKVVGNTVVANGLKKAEEEIKRGNGLALPLKKIDIFPPMVIQMIKVGEDSGSLDSILKKTADFYDSEVDTAVSQMTTLIEPLIIVFLASIVGFIVVSIVMPMFQMYNFIGQ
ncbi:MULTISPECIES: type II secretion system F family protein [Thermoanaerobacterium]|uniref:Type II secretion system F domain-containing protein n=3 Tax=Thermoanaerobacterium TaxID=28895 RepID=W9EDB6_9THEO|nr:MULTISPECIES: type II secretion system F family protein [Thermoanaerobacterium]ADK10911.1 PilG [Thermoanaerobacterium saccharolyticum JW/SL-YS485]AFK86960.1 Type II secretion system F domain-containing protein [Thermoanaerobacterium saccharolyticum JW/SL-YS485]ETO39231.1 type II secretion system F domain-containing protein [Thermoanaerobacterium aotearoense SCUT27]